MYLGTRTSKKKFQMNENNNMAGRANITTTLRIWTYHPILDSKWYNLAELTEQVRLGVTSEIWILLSTKIYWELRLRWKSRASPLRKLRNEQIVLFDQSGI